MPSRGTVEHAVANTTVSPYRTMAEPFACLATLPHSMLRVFDPRAISTFCISMSSDKTKKRPAPVSRGVAARKKFVALGIPELSAQYRLLTDAQPLDNPLITLRIQALEILQQAPSFAHHHEQTTARRVILAMNAKMLIQIVDSFAQQGYLDFRRACVATVNSVTLNQVAFGFARQRHPPFSSLFFSLFNYFRLTRK